LDDRSRLEFLAEAGRVLSESLDLETTLASLARLTIPRFADYCLLFELSAGENISLVASAHVDAGKERILHFVGERYRFVPDNPGSPIARALREGGPVLLLRVSRADGEAVTSDPALLEAFDRLDPRSLLLLPLAARGQTLGVMLLAMAAESGRAYGEDDLVVGRELSYRAALAIDNARLYTEAETANRAKDQFLAVLSHELRTPITPVLMSALRLGQDPELPERLREEIERIRRNAELQAKLIDDLLDLTRVAQGKVQLHFEAVDVHALVHQAVQVFCASNIQRKRLDCRIEDGAAEYHVWADPVRLQQVVWNLVQNAVKFTPDDGRVEVRTSNPAPGRLLVEVSDTGIGIDPEVLPRLFDAWEQGGRSMSRRFGGLGLGLALAKTLVMLHGGTLTAFSEGAGKGATFTLELATTVAPERAEELRAGGGEASLPRPLSILLVEDHEDTLNVMAEVLELSRHDVTRAASKESALRLAAARPFDLLVSDLGLPDGTGLDLMREVRERYRLVGIAVSGYGTAEDVELSRQAGFLEHLIKPVHPARLKEAIARARASIASQPS
jgi:signal transduction histidine kinase/ActR/RegA family two-component response regulator